MSKKDSEEFLLDEPTGLEGAAETYESSPRPPTPVDEDGKIIVFDFMRVEEGKDDFKYGFGFNKKIYFQVIHSILGGAHDGHRVFGFLGTSVLRGRNASPADDFLRACKSEENPATNGEYLKAVQNTFGPFQATADWELYCADEPRPEKDGVVPEKTGITVIRGYRNFPLRDDGITKEHEVECPKCGMFLAAKFVLRRFVIPRG
jgi:hypothetical protein